MRHAQRSTTALPLITAWTRDRHPFFEESRSALAAVLSLYRLQLMNEFSIVAFVIMPDHCHLLIDLSPSESVSRFVDAYKRAVCFELGRSVWQQRSHLEMVRPCSRVLDYLHENPVRWNLCHEPSLYPWSSASARWEVEGLEVKSEK